MPSGGLHDFMGTLGEQWRGLSLTMPLKREVLPLLDEWEPLVESTGAANTVLIGSKGGERSLRGFNTDVPGIVRAFAAQGITSLQSVSLLGAGATARSMIAAAASLGAAELTISARSAEARAELAGFARSLGIAVVDQGLDSRSAPRTDALLSTLPGGAPVDLAPALLRADVLFDVAYDPRPTAVTGAWLAAGGGIVIDGLELLLQQALLQVRIFVSGNSSLPLKHEDRVLQAMKSAVGRS